jgi:tRNA A-37 threonylcarbamoyl transferase component Bud32
MPLPGESLRERYLLKRELGRGGMGEVYLAHDSFTQRDVAVKFTRLDKFEDAEIGARLKKLWLNETRIAGKLDHPHIVQVHEAGVFSDHAFLVMEYVEGESLAAHTAPDRLLPVATVADIVFKVGSALDYASRLGMLHRDIKPANVMLLNDGGIKLMDFGACYLTNVEDTQVFDVGTLPFMPPEHFDNRPPSVQTDIYATGVMAYQLLAGRYPFEADTFQALLAEKQTRLFVPLEARRRDLPGELRFVVHRAMHGDPETRYASWREFCADVARALPEGDRPRESAFESARFTTLRAMAFFRDFGEPQVWELAHMSDWVEKREGETVFRAGDPGDRVYLVAEGEVRIERDGTVLNRVAAGECFGEIAYLDDAGAGRTASAVAARATRLVEIGAQSLRNASDALQSAFLRAFVRTLIGRVKHADARFLGERS